MSAAGDGSTEPHICFRPFPGENANESLLAYQNGNLRVSVLFCLLGLEHQNATVRGTVAPAQLDGQDTIIAVHSRTAMQTSPFWRTSSRNRKVSGAFYFLGTRTSKCGAGGSTPRPYRCFLTNCCEPAAYAAGSLCYTRYFPTTGIFDSSTEMTREMVNTTTDTTGTARMGSKESTWKPQRWSCSVTRAWTR